MHTTALFFQKIKFFLTITILFTVLFGLTPPLAHAQNTNPAPSTSLQENNLAPGIPLNQHTYIQSVFLEMTDAFICQITGKDMLSPQTGCLNIDPVTHQISYSKTNTAQQSVKGILGFAIDSIAVLYTPPAHTSDYINYLAGNFGIVKPTYAASTTDGLKALSSVESFWIVCRNIAYLFFVIAFIFIGLGIMLRIKIDPRTVMTIQNQIPKIVVAILLITFSLAISGLMIDAMWITTYVGINVATGTGDTTTNPQTGPNHDPLSKTATDNLYWTPPSYVDTLFDTGGNLGNHGLFSLTNEISGAMGNLLTEIISQGISSGSCNAITDFGNCLGVAFGIVIGAIAHIILWVIILIVLLVALFRVWFELLKAYMFTLMYIITAPLWIVASLLPGNPLGFGKWIRSLFVNLAVFPVTAIMFVFARIITEMFKTTPDPSNTFIPPLIGNPNMQAFGTLGALGIILMAPTMLTQLREALKVPGSKHGASIAAGLGAGSAVAGAVVNKQWANLNRRNSQTGAGEGAVSMFTDKMGYKFKHNVMGKLPGAIGRFNKQQAERQYNKGQGLGFNTHEEVEQRGQKQDPWYVHPENVNPMNFGWQQGAKQGEWRIAPTKAENVQQHILTQLKRENKPLPTGPIDPAKFKDYGWTENGTAADGSKLYQSSDVSLAEARERIKLQNQENSKNKDNPKGKKSTP